MTGNLLLRGTRALFSLKLGLKKSKKHDVGASFLKISKGVILIEKIKDTHKGKLFFKAPLNFGGRGLIKIEFFWKV